jgi:histidine triad (HIT) family protein
MPQDCIFCKIVRGDLPSTQVYADSTAVAFADIKPVAPKHTLVVPREHIGLVAADGAGRESLLGHLMVVAGNVAEKTGITGSGYRIVINQGRDAGQMVDHLHLHVIGGRPLSRMG